MKIMSPCIACLAVAVFSCSEVSIVGELESAVYPPASPPAVSWARSLGGVATEDVEAVTATSDGGFLIAGSTTTYAAGGKKNGWAIKVDASGESLWEYSFGGTEDDEFLACGESGNGYLFAGWTKSAGAGGSDLWAVRLDTSGNIVWQKTYGLAYDELIYPNSVSISVGGGCIFGGSSSSTNIRSGDYLLVKIDDTGAISYAHFWEKKGYGEKIVRLWENSDGTLLLQKQDAAYNTSSYVERTTTDYGAVSGWTLLTMKDCCFCADGGLITIVADGNGSINFHRYNSNLAESGAVSRFGTPNIDYPVAIIQSPDGGFLAMCSMDKAGASKDILLIRLGADRSFRWMRSYGGPGIDLPVAAAAAVDGGFLVAGTTTSWGGGGQDIWLLRIDAEGNPTSTPFVNDPGEEGDGEPDVGTANPSDIQNFADGDPVLTVASSGFTPVQTHAISVVQH